MTTDTEALICDCPARNMPFGRCCKLEPLTALRAAFESTVSEWGWDTYRNKAGDYATTSTNGAWAGYQAGHAAAKAETADAGGPVAFAHFAENGNIRLWAPERPRDLDGNAAQPLYTSGQLSAAVAEERERAATVCERIADDYNRREGLKYAELKTDAETGANECADAIRAGAKGAKG